MSRSLRRDLAVVGDRSGQPVDQALPVRRADQHHRERRDLAGLRQGQRLEHLVEGAEAAGEHDEALGVLHEHRLAGEEVAEVDAEVDPLVEAGLEGQLDAEADATRRRPREAPLLAASIAPGPPPVITANPASTSAAAELLALGVERVVGLGAGGAEDPDRRARARPARRSPRRTRPGSAAPATGRCAPSRSAPRASSSRWSVVVTSTAEPRRMVGPLRLSGDAGSCGHLDPSARRAASPRRTTICAIGTCSSCLWANIGSPGPKLTAGMPSAVNRATSVQPNFGFGRAADRLDERRRGRHATAPAGPRAPSR